MILEVAVFRNDISDLFVCVCDCVCKDEYEGGPIPTQARANPHQQVSIPTSKPKSTWSSDSCSEMPVDHIARSRCNEF